MCSPLFLGNRFYIGFDKSKQQYPITYRLTHLKYSYIYSTFIRSAYICKDRVLFIKSNKRNNRTIHEYARHTTLGKTIGSPSIYTYIHIVSHRRKAKGSEIR